MPQVPGVTHRWVDAGGLRVHLAEAGPEDAEPVLMLHGWPQHWYLWRNVIPRMSSRYRLLMPDLRGLGWSEVTKRGYEKDNLARDQVALLDSLGIDRVKLMGHDWGGYSGLLMCLLAPERVERFICLNTGHPWPRQDLRGLASIWRFAYQLPMVAPLLGPRVTRIRGFVKFMLNGAKKGLFSADELEAFEAPLRDRERAKATAGYYRSFQRRDAPKVLRGEWRKYRLTVPTRMLHGTGDPVITPKSLEGYEPYADDLQIEFVPDTGHFIVDAAPGVVAERALDFFSAR
jgi:pimeloyl-ACP methyl ester carboxylesterase